MQASNWKALLTKQILNMLHFPFCFWCIFCVEFNVWVVEIIFFIYLGGNMGCHNKVQEVAI